MVYLLVQHEVEDYAKWKAVFDEHGESRERAGSMGARVYRDSENPNKIAIITEWQDVQSARAFASAPGLREAMQRAGVVSQPQVTFLDEVDEQPY